MRQMTIALLGILAINSLPSLGQPASPEMRSAPIGDDGFVLYETSGNPDGEPVLTIHGGAVAGAFLPLMDEPALSDYYMIRYHRRGFGGSSDPDLDLRGLLEAQATDALALLEHLNVEKAHIVAHSGGGPVALQLARKYPDRIQSVVLLEPAVQETLSDYLAIEGLTLAESESRIDFFQSQLPFAGAPGEYDALLESLYGADWRDDLERFVPGALQQLDFDLRSQWVTAALVAMTVPDDYYVGLHQPVLFVLSAAPADSYWTNIQNLAEAPNVSIRQAADVPNHAFQMRFPEPTAREIATWLSKNRF